MRSSACILRGRSKMSLQNRPKTGGTSRKNTVSLQIARPRLGNKKSPEVPENQALSGLLRAGAGGGTRTHTPSLATDFESASSTNSNTPASLFSTSRSRCPVREIGGTSWRDIKNRIHIELSKTLDKSRFSSTAA